MRNFRKSAHGVDEYQGGNHRFEHWYRDRTVYFLTARCHERFPAFASEQAKAVFWDRFYHWTRWHGFVPWVTSSIDNHYHTLGFLYEGKDLGSLMQKLHGSVAKLVNDLPPVRRRPFFRGARCGDYFDGCIRDELQCRRAYGYTLRQSVRHGLCRDWRDYPHTHVKIDLDCGVRRAPAAQRLHGRRPLQALERDR